MSTTKKLSNITTKQITDKGVQALANRPNASAQYGVSGLSPTQLKLWFDKLATFIAEKINELQNTISADDAAAYIRLLLDEQGVENLDDLVKSFSDGTFAEKILQVYPSAAGFHMLPLQTAINNIAQALSENAEEIESLWDTCGATMKATLDTSTYTLTIHLFNAAGEVLSVHSIDMMVNTDRIVDSSVVTAKIKDLCVTTAKLANKSVTTEKLADAGVTTEKLADSGVTTPKLKDAAVTTAKVADGAVTTPKLADEAVTTEKIKSAAIIGDKLGAGSVNETKLTSALYNRILRLESEAFTSIAYDSATGKLTFIAVDGSQESVDLPLELITSGGYYDDTEGSEAVVLVLANGDEIRIPVDSMLSELIAYMNGIREKIYDLQEAPPISALSDSILLCTPTLGQLAALG